MVKQNSYKNWTDMVPNSLLARTPHQGYLMGQRTIVIHRVPGSLEGSVPSTRDYALCHYTEHMVEVTQLVYNKNIICNFIVINK